MQVIELANNLLTACAAPFWYLFGAWPLAGLLSASILAGVLLLLCYGKVSNQGALKRVKRQIHAALLEAILFRHDLKLSLRAQASMLGFGARYFALAVPPLLILAVPCLLILAQLNLFFGSEPLDPGKPGLLTVKLRDSRQLESLSLEVRGADVASPVRAYQNGEAFFRVTPMQAAKNDFAVKLGEEIVYEDSIYAGKSAPGLAAHRLSSSPLALLYPGAPLLPSPVEEISISYPQAYYPLLGLRLHWLVVFFVVSLISGIVCSRLFHVEI